MDRRRTTGLGAAATVLGLLLGLLVTTGLGAGAPAVASYDGASYQNPPSPVRVLPSRCLRAGETMPSRPGPCRIVSYGKKRPTLVVWGDSHAWQQLPALVVQARRTRTNLIAFVMGACPPMKLRSLDVQRACIGQNQQALALIKRRTKRGDPLKVLLGAFWGLYRDLHARNRAGWTPPDELAYLADQAELFAAGTPRLFRVLGRLDVPTAAIGQVPWVPEDAPDCPAGTTPYACDLPRSTAIADEARTASWVKARLARIPVSGYVDTTPFLCDADTCRATIDGAATYLDDLHLDPAVTGAFAPVYRSLFS